ncbi:hypothetical protein BH09PAT2_BH09PAT2_05120 [soil metagenome]
MYPTMTINKQFSIEKNPQRDFALAEGIVTYCQDGSSVFRLSNHVKTKRISKNNLYIFSATLTGQWSLPITSACISAFSICGASAAEASQ